MELVLSRLVSKLVDWLAGQSVEGGLNWQNCFFFQR